MAWHTVRAAGMYVLCMCLHSHTGGHWQRHLLQFTSSRVKEVPSLCQYARLASSVNGNTSSYMPVCIPLVCQLMMLPLTGPDPLAACVGAWGVAQSS